MRQGSGAASIVDHYERAGLLQRLEAALRDDGVDVDRPTIEQLAPYDQFHGRGLEATEEAAAAMPVRRGDRLLDVGSGLGGPARWIARQYGCRVVGVDLTPAFCEVATELTRRVGMAASVGFQVGDALRLPFEDACFDGAYSINVAMNIADKAAFHREIRRVLKPGGWLWLGEIARGTGPEPDYPMPWAASPSASFLATPDETIAKLVQAGFEVLHVERTRAKVLAYGERSRAIVAAGGKPPHRAVMLVHGETAAAAMRNSARAMAEGRVEPIELLARR